MGCSDGFSHCAAHSQVSVKARFDENYDSRDGLY